MQNETGSTFQGISRQAATYRSAVLKHIEPGQSCCILGFPDHNNSGDSAIYLGELKLFEEIKSSRDHVCTKDNYDREEVAIHYPEGPLFLHGGGNFGDLYGENGLRHKVLDHFKNRKIVQLPQTIHFNKPEGVEKMSRAIGEHGDVHLMLRDIQSFEFAKKHFDCSSELVPDAAYYLEDLETSRSPRRDVLSIQRTDTERSSDELTSYLESLGPIRDWRGKTAPLSHFAWVIKKHIRNRLSSIPKREASDVVFRESAYKKRAEDRVKIAVDVLSSARVVVSDRLHAHIISSLLKKPHVALDNFYGKIGNYIDAWGDDDLAIRATNIEELKSAVEQHLSGTGVTHQTGKAWALRDD